jgi:hypothetical protein
MLIFTGISAWQVTRIPASPMYAEVGATLVPALITGLLGLLSVFYAAKQPGQEPLPGSLVRLACFVGGCLAFCLLVEVIGFWLAAAIGGMGVARGFDARVNTRTLANCAAIALAFWLLFTVVLGIDLGPLLPGLADGQPLSAMRSASWSR